MKQISFKLQVFEGPLDLLLHLIHKNKVSLYDIPISEITEQYMEYLCQMEHFDIEVSSEFLVLAAHLLYIKSKLLLPRHEEEEAEEDPREELSRRLVEYKQFKEAARYLQEREFAGSHTFYKVREWIEPRLIDESLSYITTEHLRLALCQTWEQMKLRRPPTPKQFSKVVGREIVSVFSKVRSVLFSLKRKSRLRFLDLFARVRTRDEAVASFLAVLELVRRGRVRAADSEHGVVLTYIGKRAVEDEDGDQASGSDY